MDWQRYNPPPDLAEVLEQCPGVTVASTIDDLLELAVNGNEDGYIEVAYDVPGLGRYVEGSAARLRNGLSFNYVEPYMRRRDPDCMVIADGQPTDKPTFQARFGQDFDPLRAETFAWLKTQELALFGFVAGQPGMGEDAIAVAPLNAAFFAFGLALLQGIVPAAEIPPDFTPKAIIYVAPVFRHTHFEGRQVVVHNRQPGLHEMFAYNLYPGPSAKKGIYSALLDLGEQEGWLTAHCSVVQVTTPYDNVLTIMHEGASGGGKSEMLEQIHRQSDGRMLLGENLVTGEVRHLEIPRGCTLQPVSDDMTLCHPSVQDGNGKLRVVDAEDAWFMRVNHINSYGVDPHLERLTAQPNKPLLFLNIDAAPGSRALIWEHIMDAPERPCPNPRVIIPRAEFPGIIDEPVAIDIRSFGVRVPPCTRERPSYGIIGLFHLLPPALAWLWRLVAPRGYNNPSIIGNSGLESEGVGSYWPFATGRRVTQANLLLKQFTTYTQMRYILTPNQHVGAWWTGFMPQWIARDYLARRGSALFKPDQVRPARCPLLGQTIHQLQVEGRMIPRWFMAVDSQPEVGEEAYDLGAAQLYAFFRSCLVEYLEDDLDPLGRRIIECCLEDGQLADYEALIPV